MADDQSPDPTPAGQDAAAGIPPSPITALAEGAAQLHELYRTYVAAGFTEIQAMQMICAILTAGMRGNG